MCDQESETASHLILHCSFARQVCQQVAPWTGGLVAIPHLDEHIMFWWERALGNLPKNIRRIKAAVLIYTAWNIWKARNKVVFDNKRLSPVDVLHEIKMEMAVRTLACGRPELPFANV